MPRTVNDTVSRHVRFNCRHASIERASQCFVGTIKQKFETILYTLASISRHWQGLLRPASSLQSEISAILILETLLPSLPTSSGTKTS